MQLTRLSALAVTLILSLGLVLAAYIGVGAMTGMLVFAYLAAIYGGAFAIARWKGGDGDLAAIVTGRHDERQGRLDNLASTLSGTTALLLCGLGTIVSLASGDGSGGPFALILGASGIVYIVSLLVLRSRV